MMELICIDLEASGLGTKSYPILLKWRGLTIKPANTINF